MPGTITVVNQHHLPGKRLPDASHVYIGRPRAGQPLGLGNPITLADHGHDREAVLRAYRAYAQTQWHTPSSTFRGLVWALAERVRAGEDLKLVCWCAPRRCHGDVIKAAIEQLIASPAP